jgi:hypothetical protein
MTEGSMAAGYSEQLQEWLPEATEVRLVARHEGHGAASVGAFVDVAKGRAKTLTFVETENHSICGGYLDVAWVEGDYARDPRMRSFIFTLRNRLGVPPTKFVQRRAGEAAHMRRGNRFCFGCGEGLEVMCGGFSFGLGSGQTYEAHFQGARLFTGDGSGVFRAARWELWEIE